MSRTTKKRCRLIGAHVSVLPGNRVRATLERIILALPEELRTKVVFWKVFGPLPAARRPGRPKRRSRGAADT